MFYYFFEHIHVDGKFNFFYFCIAFNPVKNQQRNDQEVREVLAKRKQERKQDMQEMSDKKICSRFEDSKKVEEANLKWPKNPNEDYGMKLSEFEESSNNTPPEKDKTESIPHIWF